MHVGIPRFPNRRARWKRLVVPRLLFVLLPAAASGHLCGHERAGGGRDGVSAMSGASFTGRGRPCRASDCAGQGGGRGTCRASTNLLTRLHSFSKQRMSFLTCIKRERCCRWWLRTDVNISKLTVDSKQYFANFFFTSTVGPLVHFWLYRRSAPACLTKWATYLSRPKLKISVLLIYLEVINWSK